MQIELEAAALRAGGDAMAHDTIIGAGANSAVLHFLPTRRGLKEGQLVLIDAGAEYRGYTSDITRTYPVGGRLSPGRAETARPGARRRARAIDAASPAPSRWTCA